MVLAVRLSGIGRRIYELEGGVARSVPRRVVPGGETRLVDAMAVSVALAVEAFAVTEAALASRSEDMGPERVRAICEWQ